MSNQPPDSNYPMPQPREVTLAEDIRRVAEFRTEAWLAYGFIQPEQIVDGVFPIEGDGECRHWIIEEQGRIVATGRLSVHRTMESILGATYWKKLSAEIPFPCSCLARLVVHRNYQKHGLARSLDEHRISVAKAAGSLCVIGVPWPGREQSLMHLGFDTIGWEPPFYHAPYGAAPNGLPVMMLLL